MGIEKLTASLLADARKKAEEITRAAESNSGRLVIEEKAKQAVLLKKSEEDAMKIIEEQQKERIAWARLEAKRIINEAKEDAIKSSLEGVFGMLESLRKTSEYKEFLKADLPKAIEETKAATAQGVTVHCTKNDKLSIQPNLGNSNSVKLLDDLDSIGGAIVESNDRKIKMNVTLEALFQAKRENLRKIIYEKLFAKEEKTKKAIEPGNIKSEKGGKK